MSGGEGGKESSCLLPIRGQLTVCAVRFFLKHTIKRALPGSNPKRLSGVEPPHMPPEGIALSTELQTHSGYLRGRQMSSPFNNLNYPSTDLKKCKAQNV